MFYNPVKQFSHTDGVSNGKTTIANKHNHACQH